MLNIGCHLSAAKGYMNMGKEAKSIDANTFQFFTRNPRGGKAKAIDEQDVKTFLEFMKENNFLKFSHTHRIRLMRVPIKKKLANLP